MNWLKRLVAGRELEALDRYRRACHLVRRWNARLPMSRETTDWIQQVGEDEIGSDICAFRERLESHLKGTTP